MDILSYSDDPALSDPCFENLSFDSRDSHLSAIPAGGVAQSWRRMKLMCASGRRDLEVRNHAIRCLQRLEVQKAINDLIDIASMNNQYVLRHAAIEALGSIGKQDFGTPNPNDFADGPIDLARAGRCETWRNVAAKRLGGEKVSPNAARIDRAVASLIRENLSDNFSNPDARIVEGWVRWVHSSGVRATSKPFRDQLVARHELEGGLTVATAYSSGQVIVSGVIPITGTRPGRASLTFNSLESLNNYLKQLLANPDIPKTRDGELVAKWLLRSVIPDLQNRRADKPPHAPRGPK